MFVNKAMIFKTLNDVLWWKEIQSGINLELTCHMWTLKQLKAYKMYNMNTRKYHGCDLLSFGL